MPTYDYECEACGHAYEVFQNISEEPLKKCPECRKNKLKRLFGTGGAIVFKGSGFYQTDYRSESYKNAAKKDSSGGESKSESSGEKSTKSESSSSSGSESKSTPKSGDSKPAKPSKKKS
jgi:putative FmdB family regulatory protein